MQLAERRQAIPNTDTNSQSDRFQFYGIFPLVPVFIR